MRGRALKAPIHGDSARVVRARAYIERAHLARNWNVFSKIYARWLLSCIAGARDVPFFPVPQFAEVIERDTWELNLYTGICCFDSNVSIGNERYLYVLIDDATS